VDKGVGLILHDRTAADGRRDDQPVSLELTSSEVILGELARQARTRLAQLADHPGAVPQGTLYPYRFLMGFAGWGGGQREEEIRAGAWIQTKATWRLLFDTSWQSLWDEALGTVGATAKNLVATAQQYLN
jgi:putative AlgH/UPF0301 family transcriptional regulator